MVKYTSAVEYTKFGMIGATAAIAASVGAFCIEFLPHTLFIKKYKKMLNIHRFGEEIPLDPQVENLFEEVLDDLKIDSKFREGIKPFPIAGFNLHNAGIAESKFGAIIGIPINFTFKDKLSIENSDLRAGHNQEPINLYHPAAEDFTNSLLLSKNAQKFGIAREVLMSHKNFPIYKSVQSCILLSLSAVVADCVRTKYKVKNKPLVVVVYGVTALFGYAMWFQMRDTLYRYFEKDVDEQLSKLGLQYIEGGKEFYDKLLKKNIATRILTGTEGSKHFNRDGDEIYLFRQKKTPITHRKRFFDQLELKDERMLA